ncbi:MAG: hypothetical protein HQK52_20670 [Oligoflexia bacterium]|nr:hypothetical protein [Oligoflexia bacterium]
MNFECCEIEKNHTLYDIIVLDIGFASETSSNCGLVIKQVNQIDTYQLNFNNAFIKTYEHIKTGNNDIILILEAPLSVHYENYCPSPRSGTFLNGTIWKEKNAWFTPIGMSILGGAHAFLKLLYQKDFYDNSEEMLTNSNKKIYLYEALSSQKNDPLFCVNKKESIKNLASKLLTTVGATGGQGTEELIKTINRKVRINDWIDALGIYYAFMNSNDSKWVKIERFDPEKNKGKKFQYSVFEYFSINKNIENAEINPFSIPSVLSVGWEEIWGLMNN